MKIEGEQRKLEITDIFETPGIQAVKRGLLYCTPFVLLGSFSLLLLDFPLHAYQEQMLRLFGEHWKMPLLFIYNGTFSMISVITLLNVSYSISKNQNRQNGTCVNENYVVATVLSVYFLLLLKPFSNGLIYNSEQNYLTHVSRIGSTENLATAIVTGIFFTYLFFSVYKKNQARRKTNQFKDLNFSNALDMVVPCLVTLMIAFCIAWFFHQIPKLELKDLVQVLSSTPNALGVSLIYTGLLSVLWFFGLHGGNLLLTFETSIFIPSSLFNQRLVASNLETSRIFTMEFHRIFIFMGGAGCSIALIGALCLASRKEKVSLKLLNYSLIPAIFNINEVLMFGLPLVFNPYLFIPFLAVPALLTLTSAFAMYTGLVPLTINQDIAWTTPVLLSGYLATNSIRGVLLQLFNLSLATAVYYPFARTYLRAEKGIRQVNYKKLVEIADIHPTELFLKRGDEIGNVARELLFDIKKAVETNSEEIYFQYQPQVRKEEGLFGFECLLRYKHPVYGNLNPELVVRLIKEGNLLHQLSLKTVLSGIAIAKKMEESGFLHLDISMNMTPEQIHDIRDESLFQLIAQAKILTQNMTFEITESTYLNSSKGVDLFLKGVERIKGRIAIDDFGAGYSSIMYIKEFRVSLLKFDKELTKNVLQDNTAKEIIRNICNLCHSQGIETISEYVETKEQEEYLSKLGSKIYQGYLYAPALSLE